MQLTKLLALLSLTISINAATTQKCTGTELAGINLGSKTEILVCCNNAVGGAAGEPTATGTDCGSPDYTESPTVGTCNDPDRTIPLCCAASVGEVPTGGDDFTLCAPSENA